MTFGFRWVLGRPWLVWSVAALAYVAAVLNRSTIGASATEAAQRFSAEPQLLSVLVVLQVIVYAAAQIPAGALLDRFGARAVLTVGVSLMALGQLGVAVTEQVAAAVAARAVVGAGDAVIFIAVLHLVPNWFDQRRAPLVRQLTSMTGQLGQIVSAVGFAAAVRHAGWLTAYAGAAALSLLVAMLVVLVVREHPPGVVVNRAALPRPTAKAVFTNPGTHLAFFSHMGTQFPCTAFNLLWGIPYLIHAQELSPTTAGLMLSLTVVSGLVCGPIVGLFSGRWPQYRTGLVLACVAAMAACWTVVLVWPGRAPIWLLALLLVVIGAGLPVSTTAFDQARDLNAAQNLGVAQGVTNIGGYSATFVVIQVVGLLLGAFGGGYGREEFHAAWAVQYLVWLISVVGIVISARRTLGAQRQACVISQ
ncbi:MFS transporter [Mycolicibacterium confluentis]|uniref:MFS transporter n=1 Tax=Mycolicibacterium confluentis TaxID=28047 RepID=A0A7I7XT21_9MYCO|nr:MFS transporter [Mycolicibacterium confluentis]MCV7321157.1 MFS transporter [Mycolicibacterium confluentis]ORV21249.1 hypothetical protein AWB99_26965 [Mycolicibacterium confluentis]BBZ32367.1 MFS transporter [Mycolicibacterium confluentis]